MLLAGVNVVECIYSLVSMQHTRQHGKALPTVTASEVEVKPSTCEEVAVVEAVLGQRGSLGFG